MYGIVKGGVKAKASNVTQDKHINVYLSLFTSPTRIEPKAYL